ncbi:MAG: hypothetical protein QF464_00520, partial [Myxococcota bacterium]|nr:hypothetical protein [Myxococcota bacterium]
MQRRDSKARWGMVLGLLSLSGCALFTPPVIVVCEAGATACSTDADILECAPDGSGWVVLETCPVATTCVDGLCVFYVLILVF